MGFLFNNNLTRVVLIHKKRPAWQAGRWNGPGGNVREGETPIKAMIREFREETGNEFLEWKSYAKQQGTIKEGAHAVVHYFVGVTRSMADPVVLTQTDELVMVWSVNKIHVDEIDFVDDVPALLSLARHAWLSRMEDAWLRYPEWDTTEPEPQ